MYHVFIIMCISAISACVSELLSFILIYRTEEYKKLSKIIEGLNAKVDKQKSSNTSVSLKKEKLVEKKMKDTSDLLSEKQREMSMTKMKSTFVLGIIMLGVYGFLNQLYDGVVVAKLPFTPLSLLQGLSHRNLSGVDMTDCSSTFIYILCTLSIRANIQKLLGITPQDKNGPSLWDMPAPKSTD